MTEASMFTDLTFWHWAGAAVVLLAIELVTGSGYLLWLAVAAAITSVAAKGAFGWPLGAQFTIFAIVAVVLTLLTKPWARALRAQPTDENLNNPSQSLIGQTAVVVAPFENGLGRVRLNDTEWRARSDQPLLAEQTVTIRSVEGSTLSVG